MAKVIVDLGELDVADASEKGAEIELRHVTTGAPLGQFIGIIGKESAAFRDYVAEKKDEDRRKAAIALRRGRPSDDFVTAAEEDADAANLLALMSTSFRCNDIPARKANDGSDIEAKKGGAFLRYRGQEMPFTHDNAVKFYSDPGMVEFRKQVDKAIVDLANFIKD